MLRRNITANLLAALSDSRVVLLHGARQTGKTTLAQQISTELHPARYLTLDDAAVLTGARGDPAGFVAALDGPVVIDEIQRAPELFIPIKTQVDRDRRPGQFLLTGSANILMIPRLSESLAGRMEILTLWPLSQGEVEGFQEGFVDRIFDDEALPVATISVEQHDVVQRILRGGYPEVVTRAPGRQRAWFGSYITTILQRDVRDLSQRIERLDELPRLLTVLAGRTGTLLNVADLSRTLGIPQSTFARYLTLLRTTFLVYLIPAWAANVRKRLLKSDKVILVDTGLAAYLLGLNERGLTSNPDLWGAVLETFVLTELLKQITWSRTQPRLHHFRTAKGEEVDGVLEDPSGRLVGVEVKAAATIGDNDFRGLRALSEIAGAKFHRGVLVYLGRSAVPFSARLHALPITSLWRPIPAGRRRYESPRSEPRKAKSKMPARGTRGVR